MKIESYCLGGSIAQPELLYRVDRKLQEFGLSALAVEDFEYTDHQLLFGVLRWQWNRMKRITGIT
jgi:hypothetical protein